MVQYYMMKLTRSSMIPLGDIARLVISQRFDYINRGHNYVVSGGSGFM